MTFLKVVLVIWSSGWDSSWEVLLPVVAPDVSLLFSCTLWKQEDDKVTDYENTFAAWKEMTRTHQNQSLDTLISIIILRNIWQFAAFPYI